MTVKINNKDRGMLAIVDGSMPQYLRDTLFPKINTAYPNEVEWIDTEVLGETHSFIARHYGFWNRYSTRIFYLFISNIPLIDVLL